MKIIITGANGFLGSHLIKYFIEKKFDVIGVIRSKSNLYRIEEYKEKIKLINIDEHSIKEILKNENPNIVINTVTNYGRKDKKISSIVNTNLLFGLKFLEECVDSNVQAFINTDTLLDRSINTYSLSKAQLVDWMRILSNKKTKVINIKIEHMYGPKDDENKFIYWLINQLKQNVEKIDLTSGIQKRDFIYIDDITSAYEVIINNINAFSNYEEFELGSGNSIEVKDFIEKIYKELSNNELKLITKLNFGVMPYRENENMHMKANIRKIIELGWKPRFSIEDGIKNIIKEKF